MKEVVAFILGAVLAIFLTAYAVQDNLRISLKQGTCVVSNSMDLVCK